MNDGRAENGDTACRQRVYNGLEGTWKRNSKSGAAQQAGCQSAGSQRLAVGEGSLSFDVSCAEECLTSAFRVHYV